MKNKIFVRESLLQIAIVVITFAMIIVRFLLNEKGRINPDSIRYMRFAHGLPVIDNTVTPAGYPMSIKLVSLLGTDEFWSSKVVGLLSFLFMLFFARKKNFFYRESIMVCGLFSFVSIFAYTMSEALIMPFVFIFLYVSSQIIEEKISGRKAIFYLSISLILLYNIRYSALFFIGGCGLFGLMNWRKSYGKAFITSGAIGLAFVVLYKFLFIDYFNQNYVDEFLETGLHPTSQLLVELFQGLATTFNPFIHIQDPGGGKINYAIYGIGILNIGLMIWLFIKNKLSATDRFFIFISMIGIVCSFFVQYFYSVNPLDYRLLAPFVLSVWLLYFRKLYQNFGQIAYAITILSFASGLLFTWLSRGDYLQNRREITRYLQTEGIDKKPIIFYSNEEKIPEKIKVAELISTVNPEVYITKNPKDTLKKGVLTAHQVLTKIKMRRNQFQ